MGASPRLLAHLARINADAGVRARRDESVRVRYADPLFRARMAATLRAALSDKRQYTLVNPKLGRRESGTRAELATRLGIKSVHLASLIRGRSASARGWKIARKLAPPRVAASPAALGPKSPPPHPGQKTRSCLRCSRQFVSQHAGVRRCPRCERSAAPYQPDY